MVPRAIRRDCQRALLASVARMTPVAHLQLTADPAPKWAPKHGLGLRETFLFSTQFGSARVGRRLGAQQSRRQSSLSGGRPGHQPDQVSVKHGPLVR